ncbi:MAG: type II CAAX endopeptidase family protein [Candidatus Methanofastidiosia archaeon]|jgi:membrane protease YdiL (CAAX protease family)
MTLLEGIQLQPEDLADLITPYTEWAATHVNLLNVITALIILVTVGGLVVTFIKKKWILSQLKDHTPIEKWFIISFFVTVIGGTFLFVVALGFLGLHSTNNPVMIPLVGMVILSLLVIPGVLTCFVTFSILAFQLFVYKKPAAPKIEEPVNWGGVPVLVVIIAFFLGSTLLSFGSGVISSIIGSVLLIVLPVYLVVVTYGRTVEAMGFTFPVWYMFLFSLLLIPVIILGGEAIYRITEKVIGEFPLEEIVEYTIKESPVIMSIQLAIIGPIGEEIFFRGFAHSALKQKYGFKKGLLYSSLFFGMYHLIPWQIPYAVVAGVILGYVYEKTGSIYMCILLHIVNNAVAVIMFWV